MNQEELIAYTRALREEKRKSEAERSEKVRADWRRVSSSSFQSAGYDKTLGLYRAANPAGGQRPVDSATAAGLGTGQSVQVTAAGANQSWADTRFLLSRGSGLIESTPGLRGGGALSGLQFPGVGGVQPSFTGNGNDRFARDGNGRCSVVSNDTSGNPRQRDTFRIPDPPTMGNTFSYSGTTDSGNAITGSITSSGNSFTDAQALAADINSNSGSSGIMATARDTSGGASVDVECPNCTFDGDVGDDLPATEGGRSFATRADCEADAREEQGMSWSCFDGICMQVDPGTGSYDTQVACEAARVLPYQGGNCMGDLYIINATITMDFTDPGFVTLPDPPVVVETVTYTMSTGSGGVNIDSWCASNPSTFGPGIVDGPLDIVSFFPPTGGWFRVFGGCPFNSSTVTFATQHQVFDEVGVFRFNRTQITINVQGSSNDGFVANEQQSSLGRFVRVTASGITSVTRFDGTSIPDDVTQCGNSASFQCP